MNQGRIPHKFRHAKAIGCQVAIGQHIRMGWHLHGSWGLQQLLFTGSTPFHPRNARGLLDPCLSPAHCHVVQSRRTANPYRILVCFPGSGEFLWRPACLWHWERQRQPGDLEIPIYHCGLVLGCVGCHHVLHPSRESLERVSLTRFLSHRLEWFTDRSIDAGCPQKRRNSRSKDCGTTTRGSKTRTSNATR